MLQTLRSLACGRSASSRTCYSQLHPCSTWAQRMQGPLEPRCTPRTSPWAYTISVFIPCEGGMLSWSGLTAHVREKR